MIARRRGIAAERRGLSCATEAEDRQSGEADVELPARVRRQHDIMKGLLDLLSKDDREVLLLRIGQGLSVARTAELLGIKPGAVKMRTRRAQQRLNEMAARLGLRPGGV